MTLPKYRIPRDLKSAIEDTEKAAATGVINTPNKFSLVLNKLKNIDSLEIAECHYLQLLKLGLYLEEYEQRKDMNTFKMHGAIIQRVDYDSNKFKIYIKNFDKDNSVLNTSDSLQLYDASDPGTEYFLKVAKIGKDHILVIGSSRFCEKYKSLTSYKIELIFNTYSFQCCHYALSMMHSFNISRYIFPKKRLSNPIQLFNKESWFNSNILNNPEQKQAVYNIVNKSSLPAPYILYGPPGTGKTSTLVEAICQVWKQESSNCILICTPSNAASDVITKKLLVFIPPNVIYRMYSSSQEYSTINKDIKKCCNYNKDGTADSISKMDFSCKKIIITTLCTSLRLEKFHLRFSHMFIDEAGQANQAEALLPFFVVKSSLSCQIVLSGDHNQLGPCVRSDLAEPILGQSVLEKLMKNEPYRKNAQSGYDSRYITKLIRNYRSCSDLIHVSNVLFYDNELIACTKEKELSTFPVNYYAVEGKEQKCSGSKSSYNEEEINKVLVFTKKFVGEKVGGKIIKKEDIGIITPFTLQASKIRKKLNDAGLNEVEVGTVEIYQGQEKEIIIISTVRSKTFNNDGIEHLGFLSNPKRFNVALTRAKTFLMVIGSPSALQTNKHWRYFLKFCQKNNACDGESFVMKNDLFNSLQQLSIGTKIKESTDLFDQTFAVLSIDDGEEVDILRKSNRTRRNNNYTSLSNIRFKNRETSRSWYLC